MVAAAGIIVLRGAAKGVDSYEAFLNGARRGMKSAYELLPALCAMLLMLGLMNGSGASVMLARAASPLMKLLNLPQEAAQIVFLRPLTGSGSLAALEGIFAEYGADSRVGRIASVLMGSSETVFYTMSVYLAAVGVKKLPWVLPVSLAAYLCGAYACGLIV